MKNNIFHKEDIYWKSIIISHLANVFHACVNRAAEFSSASALNILHKLFWRKPLKIIQPHRWCSCMRGDPRNPMKHWRAPPRLVNPTLRTAPGEHFEQHRSQEGRGGAASYAALGAWPGVQVLEALNAIRSSYIVRCNFIFRTMVLLLCGECTGGEAMD